MYTIAVIEDQPVLASAYRSKFQGEGFNVEVALDGQQGLDLISRIKPDLVLLDMHLPTLSGLEILKQVRANPDFQTLPIIVLSNLTKPGAIEDAWRFGATLVLSKLSTSPKRVLESVKATLESNAADAPAAVATMATDPATLSAVPPVADNEQSARGNILLVETHPDLSTLLSFMLQRTGHQVTTVRTSDEALKQTGEQSFDLFVLGRADRAGLLLCQKLRQARPDKPIIFYSTAALFSEPQEGLQAGASAYLAKPEDLFNIGQIALDLISSQTRLAPRLIRVA